MIPFFLGLVVVAYILYNNYKKSHSKDNLTDKKESKTEEKKVKKEEKVKETEKPKVKAKKDASGKGFGRKFMEVVIGTGAVVVVLILIITLASMVIRNLRKIDLKPPVKPATATEQVCQPQKHWILSWHKPDGYAGGNPKLRDLPPEDVVMQRKDSEVMEFTAKYLFNGEIHVTHFVWDKKVNKEYGDWYQDSPKQNGRWYLEPEGENYSGWESDETGYPHVVLYLKKC